MGEDTIALPGQDYDSIPFEILNKNTNIKTLDLSFNNIKKVESLDNFKQLVSLVLDNNQIESNNDFSNLPNLKTLSLNNNNISDLREFIESIKNKFPNLTFLSLLKNPACPNYYFTGADFNDYQKYRYYILYHLKHLKFLDSTPVTAEERKEAERTGVYSLPAKPVSQNVVTEEVDEDEPTYRSLSSDLAPEGKGKASFGVSTYVYYGRQSEGNRFIMNDDL
ncbi:hypothetical protein DICPUDRAFT_81395 [Dictyostelium purpureum]|uniref:Leucine-rich repeat-containing protein n=1 Tax=Dictyostelium purpureum TaxID=5786 RepID=F0ZTC7_DICPU|nr:uncharacterized protein DICPUDRAFT_81395 [Dictyostelium purpureum]EGC32813.1 hypothetical protein DICPUDRAFT_81395 [Dictyostelium purpureum]|eukprot:XP_003290671.1 hypothetical protein DICPUDRAFT_81395 [Dictyostelium purpureum]